ncbi:MAG: tRNA (adenosine(37)-N6)-threonylcarbamoyltransferase complex dimerization subunit type 1 TsaB [bacterium]|nr:tRNA (adenosine(37)-N6)-threonylcarbamoyltransferase complex dimerization subunit type 1 TsaB [bacterium]
MNWLLLDTACPRAMVALTSKGKIVSQLYLETTLQHGEKLAQAIAGCLLDSGLQFKDLNGVAVGQGPGSFVGVRVAIAHAKGICLALNIPLMGICTLSAIACGIYLEKNAEGLIFLDARRREFYALSVNISKKFDGVAFRGDAKPFILSVEEVAKLGLSAKIAGFLSEGKTAVTVESHGVSAEGMLVMVNNRLRDGFVKDHDDEVYSLFPLYIRSPDAKPPSFLS